MARHRLWWATGAGTCVYGAQRDHRRARRGAAATPTALAAASTPAGTSIPVVGTTPTTVAAAAVTTVAAAAVVNPTETPKSEKPTPTPKPDTPTPTPKAPTPTATPRPSVGQTVSVKNWDITVKSADRLGKELVWSQYGNKSQAAGEWLVVLVEMKNTGDRNFGVNTHDFELKTAAGATYTVSSDLGAYTYSEAKGGQRIGGQVPPGVAVHYHIVFDVAPDATGLTFTFKQDKRPTFDLSP